MNRVFIGGLGAVSPAGWGVPALGEALERGDPVPARKLERSGGARPVWVREVPPASPQPAFLAHPRLRRATAVARFAAAVGLEAMADVSRRARAPLAVGLIACLQSGCVEYSCRFFTEVLQDPTTASPVLFPETVFASAASHVAAVVGRVTRATTLVGDPGAFLRGLALGSDWLYEGGIEVALVVSADETNWMHSHAAWHLDHYSLLASGGGAVALTSDSALSTGVELERITEPTRYTARCSRARAAHAMRAQLPKGDSSDLLVDGTQHTHRADWAELSAWRDWPGGRLSPKRVLGDGLCAGVAWQCVAACDALIRGKHPTALVSVVGCNQEAVGARFVRQAPSGR